MMQQRIPLKWRPSVSLSSKKQNNFVSVFLKSGHKKKLPSICCHRTTMTIGTRSTKIEVWIFNEGKGSKTELGMLTNLDFETSR